MRQDCSGAEGSFLGGRRIFHVLVRMGGEQGVFIGRSQHPGLPGEFSALRRSGIHKITPYKSASQPLFLHGTHLECLLKMHISGLFSA